MNHSNYWPRFFWQIKNLHGTRTLKSPKILVKGINFRMILEKICYLNSADDCFEVHLQEMPSNGRHISNFLVSIYIKDILGDKYFHQKSEFVRRQFVSSQCVWKVRLADLLQAADFDWNESAVIVCEFGRKSGYHDISEDSYSLGDASSYGKSLEKLSTDFSDLLNQRSKVDVVITCGEPEEHIYAHENVLSVRSPVFSEMFQKNVLISTPRIIKIDNISSLTFKRFIKFLYTGKIFNMSVNDDRDLYVVGHKFKVQTLMEECAKVIMQKMTVDLAYTFLPLAKELEDEDFKCSIIYFIFKKNVLSRDHWFRFSETHPDLSIEVYFLLLDQFLEKHYIPTFSTDVEILMDFENFMSDE